MQIKIFEVIYDEKGKKLADEGEIRSDESEPECFKGIFNADLLDSDYLNELEYLGSMTDSEDKKLKEKGQKNQMILQSSAFEENDLEFS